MAENTVESDGTIARHMRLTHLSEHLANERTYLAYLRTSVSLMSFGFAINRFGLYLEQSREMPIRHRFSSALVGSEQLGIAMVLWPLMTVDAGRLKSSLHLLFGFLAGCVVAAAAVMILGDWAWSFPVALAAVAVALR